MAGRELQAHMAFLGEALVQLFVADGPAAVHVQALKQLPHSSELLRGRGARHHQARQLLEAGPLQTGASSSGFRAYDRVYPIQFLSAGSSVSHFTAHNSQAQTLDSSTKQPTIIKHRRPRCLVRLSTLRQRTKMLAAHAAVQASQISRLQGSTPVVFRLRRGTFPGLAGLGGNLIRLGLEAAQSPNHIDQVRGST